MALEFQLLPALRAAAWLALLAVGVAAWVRRPDAAGRAFAFWALVWAGGIQALLSVQAMATDAPTQALLYRADYYAILLSSPAFAALLLYAPVRARRAGRWLALALAPGLLAGLLFALDHGPFLAEAVQDGAYAAPNTGLMVWLYHPFIWTGFLAGMLWLGWRAPRLEAPFRASAHWLMAGLALFAADRFARTWTWFVRDPASLPGGTEGAIYGLYMALFGLGVLWMVVRARPTPAGSVVLLAALAGGAAGATGILTYSFGGTAPGVLLSALLAPAYGLLLARGVALAQPADAVALAARDRVALLREVEG